MKEEMKIVFMGTPGFAVPSLEILIANGFQVAAVVTVPDKPAGRGQVIKYSPVKDFALYHNLKLLQPSNLKDPGFIDELQTLQPDLMIVVAFRMLPQVIWKLPRLGTFNLHASLLPQYRGAAPINWAIINGEKETGITTFFINENIDTGKILFSEKTAIGDNETAGELHDRLMVEGAKLVLKTVQAIQNGNFNMMPQDHLVASQMKLKLAPKIFKEDCRIDWTQKVNDIHNFIRGLSPYPAAFTNLHSMLGESLVLKVFKAKPVQHSEAVSEKQKNLLQGNIITDSRSYLYVVCGDGLIALDEIQLEGKRRMLTVEFLRGFKIDESWKLI
jgi:methionyl-tRNA formyltransferase